MANFSALKQSIQNYIKQNGNKEITGNILQNILLSMVTTMGDGAINDNASDISDIKSDIQNINGDITNINGDITNINGDITGLNGDLSDEVNRAKGAETTTVLFSDGKLVFKNAAGTVLYQLSVDSILSAITTRLNTGALYAGYATPSTTPAALTSQEVFYLATQAGTYTNFHFNGGDDPIVLTKDGIYFIVSGNDDDDWNAEPILQLDDVPTASSNNAVKSGGVAEELALGAVYDVSAKNPTAGLNNDGKWESLSALLSDANLNTLIPTSVRKGGMSIKFVCSSDNNYVQYRLMSDSFNTTVANWQGVDDEPTAGSGNLVKSGGVKNALQNLSMSVMKTKYDWIKDKDGYIDLSGNFVRYGNYVVSKPVNLKAGDIVNIIANSGNTTIVARVEEGQYIAIQQTSLSNSNSNFTVLIPVDGTYVFSGYKKMDVSICFKNSLQQRIKGQVAVKPISGAWDIVDGSLVLVSSQSANAYKDVLDCEKLTLLRIKDLQGNPQNTIATLLYDDGSYENLRGTAEFLLFKINKRVVQCGLYWSTILSDANYCEHPENLIIEIIKEDIKYNVGIRDRSNYYISYQNKDTPNAVTTLNISTASMYLSTNIGVSKILAFDQTSYSIRHEQKLIFNTRINTASIVSINYVNKFYEYDIVRCYSGYLYGGIASQIPGNSIEDEIWFERLRNAVQVSDGLSTTAACASQCRLDTVHGIVGTFLQCGFGEKDEAELIMCLELFQVTQPTKTKHIVMAYGGEFDHYNSQGIPVTKEQMEAEARGETWLGYKIGTDIRVGHEGEDIYFIMSNELNGVYCGNLVWRALTQINHYGSNWVYRDYDLKTDTLSDAHYMILKDTEENDYGVFGPDSASAYAESKGYNNMTYNIFTSAIYEDGNGRKYGAITDGSGSYPILVYSDDNFATCIAFAIFPSITTWEASFIKDGNNIWLSNRRDTNNANLAAYSTDGGETWTTESRVGTNNRPRIYKYNGNIYWFTGINGRNGIELRKGNTFSIATVIFHKEGLWGTIYPDFIFNNGHIYMVYTDSELYNERTGYTSGTKATAKFVYLCEA